MKPLGDGLLDTSMWVAKLMAPSDISEGDDTKAILEIWASRTSGGWLSNVPLISMAFFYSSFTN